MTRPKRGSSPGARPWVVWTRGGSRGSRFSWAGAFGSPDAAQERARAIVGAPGRGAYVAHFAIVKCDKTGNRLPILGRDTPLAQEIARDPLDGLAVGEWVQPKAGPVESVDARVKRERAKREARR